MSIATLDISDSNLQLWHGTVHLQSPGYALLDGPEYRFGKPARDAARLRPRDINTRYWWQLSTEALQPALGPARHTADLVHSHLLDIHAGAGAPPELLLAVSGSMQRDQLALLLGIVQQCPFDAVGLVNRSVALGSLYGGTGRLFHLEIQLHQAVLSELACSDGRVALQRTLPLPGCGLLQLQERLVENIATAFIRQTRFDPRRKAATEQQLYDTLPAALRALGQGDETNLEVNGYRARINGGELRAAGQRLFDSAAQAMGEPQPQDLVIADPLAALLPGLEQNIPGLQLLPADAMQQALEQHQERLVQRGQALSFITSLPALEQTTPDTPERAEATPQQPERRAPAPTHLLQGARARALTADGTALGEGWELYQSGESWQLRGHGTDIRVNGAVYQPGQALSCGDTLSIGPGQDSLLIEVLP